MPLVSSQLKRSSLRCVREKVWEEVLTATFEFIFRSEQTPTLSKERKALSVLHRRRRRRCLSCIITYYDVND